MSPIYIAFIKCLADVIIQSNNIVQITLQIIVHRSLLEKPQVSHVVLKHFYTNPVPCETMEPHMKNRLFIKCLKKNYNNNAISSHHNSPIIHINKSLISTKYRNRSHYKKYRHKSPCHNNKRSQSQTIRFTIRQAIRNLRCSVRFIYFSE